MRRALPLLLFLAACEPRRDPRAIERALSAKAIDVEALEDLLAVEEGALRLIRPDIDPVCTSPPEEGWFLDNGGRRPVWLRRSDLHVDAGIFPLDDPDHGSGHWCPWSYEFPFPSRPGFRPEEWILLEREKRLRLPLMASVVDPGTYDLRVHVFVYGRYLCLNAREFNEGKRLPFVYPDRIHVMDSWVSFLLLPPVDLPGAPWHGTHPVDPEPLVGQRFEVRSEIDSDCEASFALQFEAFVRDVRDRIVYRGPLKVESHDILRAPPSSGGSIGHPQNRAIYTIPGTLPRGEYRILVRTEGAYQFFVCGHQACRPPRGAASRWIPFRVE